MTLFRLGRPVADAFPDTLVTVVTAGGLRPGPWPATVAALAELEDRLAEGPWRPADETDPRVESWHAAYRAFGTNPRRIRPSVDALGRRLLKKGSLPRINPAVDSYNLVSVRHGLPAGAFDLDHVTGEVEIRFADGTESFTPLGEPDTVETPKAGEVVYSDADGILTRHWNHRDAHRTRVTEDSARVAFILETVAAARDGQLVRDAAEELTALLGPHCEATAVHHLDPTHPTATV
ncbi:B3/4 domain-containing protein (plasmid) [Streptomyces sp. BI20]|uniref:B3/B4 domain-containing protein n=1 Tax=Streptomyces sp. BI20 TaxID=3403460 RepID=UPI003C795613